MAELNETHPFLVSVWLPGNANPKSLFEKGYWMEMARCMTKHRADEIALCLSLRHSDCVQVAELVSEPRSGWRWQGCKYIPASARELGKEGKQV